MEKLKYLNLGCGSKFHKDWINVDMASNSEDVIAANLLEGIPFPDNYFDVVYHSQVLEHFPREKAPAFVEECFRVLKPGGTMRVVVPDLENIVDEYKKHLNKNLEKPDALSEANYDWIMLEMYDQTVRNYPGGQMAEYLRKPEVVNESYVIGRMGHIGRNMRDSYLAGTTSKTPFFTLKGMKRFVRKMMREMREGLMFRSEASRIGAFRLGGEIHQWMYDRYSLGRLLKSCGFSEVSVKGPYESSIPGWEKYELDVKDGAVYDPTSLIMEAKKMPASLTNRAPREV